MRLVVLLSICLLCIPLALASPDVVFDKVISHGTSFELNETSYTAQISSANHSLVKLVSLDETILLDEGECVDREYSTFCYVIYDEDQKIEATLTDYRPFIEVERSLSAKKLNLGARSTIDLVFENTGGTDITDFSFIETIPPSLTLISGSGCEINEDNSQQIIFEEDLLMDSPITCSYIVEANTKGVFSYEGKLYTDQLLSSQDAEAIPQAVITNENLFNLDINSSKYDLDVGQPFVLSITVENIETGKNGDNLSIEEITINLDESFAVKSISNSPFRSIVNTKRVRLTGIVLPEETWEQKIELEPLVLDENISIDVNISYSLGDDEIVSFVRSIPFTQFMKPLRCEYVVVDEAGNNLITLDELNHTLPGFDRGELFVKVYNDNYYVSAYDLRYTDSGSIDFPSKGRISSLRKNDKDILTSADFIFDKESSFTVKSSMDVKYTIMDEKFESSCSGNILVEKPKFLQFEKELSFLNVTIGDSSQKLLPHVKLVVANDFFLPIRNIQISEILPSAIFSNNNTKKEISLGVLDDDYFEYDFIIPEDYVSIKGSNIKLETIVSYTIFENDFSESVILTVNTNDVLSAQKGVVLDSLIDAKLEQIKIELNKSFIASQPIVVVNESSDLPTTYSPFLDYFSISLMVFLALLALIFLNIRYNGTVLLKRWFLTRRVERFAKKETSFASEYSRFKNKRELYVSKLAKAKSVLKSLKKNYIKEQKEYKRAIKNIKSKEVAVNASLNAEQRSIAHLANQKKMLENRIASLNKEITSQEQKKQSFEVLRVNKKTDLEKKNTDILKTKEFIDLTSKKMKKLDSSLEHLKSDFETSYTKNKSVLDLKLHKVKDDLSHLDDEYDSKRKILKEEEHHLEQSEQ